MPSGVEQQLTLVNLDECKIDVPTHNRVDRDVCKHANRMTEHYTDYRVVPISRFQLAA